MQIAVTYKDGVLIPQRPLNLRRNQLIVTIPDQLVKKTEQNKPSAGLSMRERINQVLGEHARTRPQTGADSDKAMWQQHLADKYLSDE